MADPLYIRHSELQHVRGDLRLILTRAAENIVPRCIIGAQKIRGMWYLYVSGTRARYAILQSDLIIMNTKIHVLDFNPYESNTGYEDIPLEKIVFKDIPLHDMEGTNLIYQYLEERPHIKIVGDVCYSKLQGNNRRNTQYWNGDRYVMALANFSPSIPSNTQIGEYNVRVYHRSQAIFCSRCNTKNLHKTSDTDKCDAYRTDKDEVLAFRSDWNILSNFFVCNVHVFGKNFRSAEHAYQWRKCVDCLRPDLALKILKAPTPKRAKLIASQINDSELRKWNQAYGHTVIMKEVLSAKSVSNVDFRMTILKSEKKIIAEATQDLRWGTGLSPHLTRTTKTFPGKNLLGKLLMELRNELQNGCNPTSPSIPQSQLPTDIDLTKPPPGINDSQLSPKVKRNDSTINLIKNSAEQIQPCTRSIKSSCIPEPKHSTATSGDVEFVDNQENKPPANSTTSINSGSNDNLLTSAIHVQSLPGNTDDVISSCDDPGVPCVLDDITSNCDDVTISCNNVPSVPDDIPEMTGSCNNESDVLYLALSKSNTCSQSSIKCDTKIKCVTPPKLVNVKKRSAASPLVGKLFTSRRRIMTPLRRVLTDTQYQLSDDDVDSDDDSICWDKDSIAGEIMTCSDFDGVFANNIVT